MKLMQRVNICSVNPSFSRPLQSALACCQLTSGPFCIINAWSLSEFWGFCLSTCLLKIDHKFSIGLRSGEFPGHGPKILMFYSPSHLVNTFALWQGAPSSWKRHCSSPNVSWMVGRSCSRRMCWYHSFLMAVFLGKIVSEPLAEK